MSSGSQRIALGWGLLLLMLLANTNTVADNSPGQGSWEYAGEVYLWGAGIGGNSAAGDDIDISFSDLIENLDLGFMGSLVASKDRWTLFADFVDLDVEDDTRTTANLIGNPLKLDIDVELKGFISALGGAYRVLETDTTSLNLLAGARYLWLEADLDIAIGPGISQKYKDSGHVWDAIAGIRGKTELSNKWYLAYYLDAGAGDSEFTWQALGGLNYRFEKVDAVFGYRHIDWEFDDNDTFDDLNMSGPYAGVKFRF